MNSSETKAQRKATYEHNKDKTKNLEVKDKWSDW